MPKTAKYQKGRLRRMDAAGVQSWAAVLPKNIADIPPRGELTCIGCPAPLRLTRSYTRGSGTEVPAYLSLYPGSEHAADCELELTTLHTKPHGTNPDTTPIEDKVLYLHLPDEDRVANRQSAQRRTGAGGDHDTWAATMNSAAAIARYLEQFENPGDQLNELKIRYRDHRGEISEIFWSDFCFKARSPEALRYFRRVQADGDDAPPAAVIFPVKSRTENETHRFMRVDTGQRIDPADTTRLLYLSVAESLQPDQQLLRNFDADNVLVLGHAVQFPWTVGPNVTEMRFIVHDRWQFATL